MHILFADDLAATRDLTKISLERAGYKVTVADGRKELLQILKSGPRPDVIVTDNSMPQADEGLRVLCELGKNPAFKNIPVILCSGDSDKDALNKLVGELGGTFIPKEPFPFPNLVRALSMIPVAK